MSGDIYEEDCLPAEALDIHGWEPLSGRVFVELDKGTERTTESGLVLAEKKSPFKAGKIVAKAEYLHFHAGDTVIFPANVGKPVDIEGKTYHSLTYDQILAVKRG